VKAELKPNEAARCVRCGDVLYTNHPNTIDRSLAMSITSLVLLIASLSLPFLTLSRSGINSDISVLDAAWSLVFSEVALLGVFVTLLIVFIPLTRLLLMIYVMVVAKFGFSSSWPRKWAFRLANFLEPWAMADVFLIGVVVSLIKINELAVLDIGPAFWAWVGLIVTTIALSMNLSKDTLWRRISHP
jgi:paraquat-inducible protein A